jgi:hypothetical protein
MGAGMGAGARSGRTVGGSAVQADNNRRNNHGLARNGITGEDDQIKMTRRV